MSSHLYSNDIHLKLSIKSIAEMIIWREKCSQTTEVDFATLPFEV